MDTKATRIDLCDVATAPMRVFHLAWMALFACFFAWFAVAPLMPLIRADLCLGKDQIANLNIAAVGVTILARLLIGPLCDRFGPRRTYAWLLGLGALPVIGIGLAQSYEGFLFFRLGIGLIGASFVVTQMHTSALFAPNVVGTANAIAAGWGNAGGGATQAVMPLIVAAVVALGVEPALGWRVALLVPGAFMLAMSLLYHRHAQDAPLGARGDAPAVREPANTFRPGERGRALESLVRAASNYRVWMLFVAYAASFGVELTIHNVAALHFVDRFGLDFATAGLCAGAFGLLALFARALGGYASDRYGLRAGLEGRARLLAVLLLLEGAGLLLFAHMESAATALAAMLAFGLFTHMVCGATFGLVPFVDRRALGSVAGIVGAGGNAGAVAAGFLMKSAMTTAQGLLVLGCCVVVGGVATLAVRFSTEHEASELVRLREALAARAQQRSARSA